MNNRFSTQPRVYTVREWRIRQIVRWTLAVLGVAALIAAVVTATRAIRLRPAGDPAETDMQTYEAAAPCAAEITADIREESAHEYEIFREGSGPWPEWYRPWEPMCAEWTAVDGAVDKTLNGVVDSVDAVVETPETCKELATNLQSDSVDYIAHPPIGIDPGGIDWNICTAITGWDGHIMEIWEMDLFARIMYLEFWGTSRTCCEAGADSILRLWESGYFGRTIFETLSAVSESGALVYTTYGYVWDVEYDPAGLSEMRELCEERFAGGPEWCAPFFQLYEYPSWAIPCYEIDGVFFSTSPWLEG